MKYAVACGDPTSGFFAFILEVTLIVLPAVAVAIPGVTLLTSDRTDMLVIVVSVYTSAARALFPMVRPAKIVPTTHNFFNIKYSFSFNTQ
ncbi:hypothetical protein MZM54_28735 [[Brevibacterium] frigoritolerans]|nr:hypothetical protein [Peribacillus frigoritolerans]